MVFDLETFKSRLELLSATLVCLSYCARVAGPSITFFFFVETGEAPNHGHSAISDWEPSDF